MTTTCLARAKNFTPKQHLLDECQCIGGDSNCWRTYWKIITGECIECGSDVTKVRAADGSTDDCPGVCCNMCNITYRRKTGVCIPGICVDWCCVDVEEAA